MDTTDKKYKLPNTSHCSLCRSRSGMTIVEILISVVLLTMMVGATYTILNIQRTKSIQVQKTSVLQTDAQVVLSLMKFDLLAAGLAYPKVDTSVISLNDSGPNSEDAIRLKAVGLGFESGRIKWSWLLEAADANIVTVRGFDDSLFNFSVDDTVVALDANRKILDPPGEIVLVNVQPDTFVGDLGPVLAQVLTLNKTLKAIAGLTIIGKFSTIYYPGLKLEVSNNQLVRGPDILLDNVEDLQFAYGIDRDGDGVIETWTNDIPEFATLNRKWAIRYTLVVTSRPIGGYTYPDDAITIEDHTYTLTADQKRQKRAILTGIIAPPNLQP